MLKKFLLLPVLLLLVLAVASDYFHAGFPFTHDGENHLARFANYKVALREGQWPPRFAPNLVNHYGYPVFNYNYPLANILSVPFSLAGFNYELTFKILVFGLVLVGGWGVLSWLEKLDVDVGGMLVGLILYLSSPFLWSTVLYRGNIGEIAAFALFPWLLVIVETLRRKEKSGFWQFLALMAFMLAHNITVMFGLPLMVIYAVIRLGGNKKSWVKLSKRILIGIGSTLWFWLPAIAEKNLVSVGQAGLVSEFANHFATSRELLFSQLGFGFSQLGSVDGLGFHLGYAQILILLIASLYVAKNWQRFNLLKWFLLSAWVLVIFQTEITKGIWQSLPLVSFIQFPWRLSIFFCAVVAGLGGLLWAKLRTGWKRVFFVVAFLQLVGLIGLKPVDYFHRDKIDYDFFSQSTTTQNENTPLTFTYQNIGEWQPQPVVATGSASVSINEWRGSRRTYALSVEETSLIIEPTMYFAGWQTQIHNTDTNQRTLATYVDNEEIGGRIAYQLETGNYEISTRFTQQTWPRIIGNLVSLAVLLIWLYKFLAKKWGQKNGLFFTWTLGLALLSFLAPDYLAYLPSFPYSDSLLASSGLSPWLYSWANFDGVHYLTIIQQGYVGTGLIQAFFPLFPLLVKGLSIFGQPIMVGLVLNLVMSYLLVNVWLKLIKHDRPDAFQFLATAIILLFPTAFFLHGFYTETLFLWLVLSSFYQARQGKWLRAGLLAALVSATRIVGIALVPALMFELWQQHQGSLSTFWPKQKGNLLKISLGFLGLGAYMLFLWQKFNDPLYFFHVQAEFGGGRQESLVLYPQVVWRYLKILWANKDISLTYFAAWQEFLAGTLGLIAIVFSWFKVRKSYVIFSLLAFLIPTLTGTFSSMPRYLLVCFSGLIWWYLVLEKNKKMATMWLLLSTSLLIFNTILFIQGYWVA